jgi:cytochrome b subunit of formate dehydrogenase
MGYLPHIGRTIDLFLCFVLIILAGLNVFFRFPELAILVSVIVGCAAIWVIANYISLASMIHPVEKTA